MAQDALHQATEKEMTQDASFQSALQTTVEATWTNVPGLSIAKAALLTVNCYEGGYPAIIILTKIAWYGVHLFYFAPSNPDETPAISYPRPLSVQYRRLGQWTWESKARRFVEEARQERERRC